MRFLTGLTLVGSALGALQVDITSDASIKAAAKELTQGMLTYYTGNKPGGTPGILVQPYYWWEAGAMMGQLINYANLTGDTQYNQLVFDALMFQIGENKDFMPQNQTKDLGNDDQMFWALAALDAAESNFQNPSDSQPSWLSLAQAVFNDQIGRWETQHCNGGLRWQIFTFNVGYDYKNTISTGGLFQLAARLARFTGDQIYLDWAEKTWQWMWGTPIFARNSVGNETGDIWDGVYIVDNCTHSTQTYWSYNVGTLLSGAAYMYNLTNGNSTWDYRMRLLLQGTNVFFVESAGANNPPKQPPPPGGKIACEVACEPWPTQTCNNDEPSFKAFLMRWMAVMTQLVPWTHDMVMDRMKASAAAAVTQCSGTANGRTDMCGRRWYQNTWDGFSGVGEQMSALSVFQNLLIDRVAPPLTAQNGGTSKSDPTAGGKQPDQSLVHDKVYTMPITAGDRAGAGILTALALIMVIAGTWWMLI